MSDGPTLVLIPGLGADAEIYRPQREYFGERLVIPPWIEARKDEPLSDYSRRLARVIDAMEVPKPYWIGGCSFGGMVAGEIAEARPGDVAGLLLIASCRRREQVTRLFRLAASVGPKLPFGVLRASLNRVVPRLFAAAERFDDDPELSEILMEVAYRTDVSLAKWAARAIRDWSDGAHPTCEVYYAHGGDDLVIPPYSNDLRPGIDLLVPGGRHLIHLTHASVVNRWIASKIDAPRLT